VALDAVHRFSDPEYADLSLLMRTGDQAGKVFDRLVERGQIVVHATEVERLAVLTAIGSRGATVIADTRDQVTALNASIRDHRRATGAVHDGVELITRSGTPLGLGDHITTRRNDRELDVANRDRWRVVGIDDDGNLSVHGDSGGRKLPAIYVREHVELAYATTVHGAQGDTVESAHLLVGDATGAAAAYVGMTRGRHHNTAHLVADTVDEARTQWIAVFSRDRADLGPAHARQRALQDIDRYGLSATQRREHHWEPPPPSRGQPSRGISI
jgi:ATP-dependent exoDNAse (exonuclease V) alpha subunit